MQELLKEAVKRLRDTEWSNKWAHAVVAAYLDDHPSDDEPVDVDWLDGLLPQEGDMGFLTVELVDRAFHLVGHGGYVSPKPATRGDVRRVCRAFGKVVHEGIPSRRERT